MLYKIPDLLAGLRNVQLVAVANGYLAGISAVDTAIEYIEHHEAAASQESTSRGPTLQECVAAMNRHEFRGTDDWALAVESLEMDFLIEADEAMILGEGLIARERRRVR